MTGALGRAVFLIVGIYLSFFIPYSVHAAGTVEACTPTYEGCLKNPNETRGSCVTKWYQCILRKCNVNASANACNRDQECQRHCTEEATTEVGVTSCCSKIVGPDSPNTCPQKLDGQCKANNAQPTSAPTGPNVTGSPQPDTTPTPTLSNSTLMGGGVVTTSFDPNASSDTSYTGSSYTPGRSLLEQLYGQDFSSPTTFDRVNAGSNLFDGASFNGDVGGITVESEPGRIYDDSGRYDSLFPSESSFNGEIETTNLRPVAVDEAAIARSQAEAAAARLAELQAPKYWWDPTRFMDEPWGGRVGTEEEIVGAQADVENATRHWYEQSRLAANSAADQLRTAQFETNRILNSSGGSEGLLNNPGLQSELARQTGDASFYEDVMRGSSRQAGEAFAFAQQHGVDLSPEPTFRTDGSDAIPVPQRTIEIDLTQLPPEVTQNTQVTGGTNIADGGLNIPPDPIPTQNTGENQTSNNQQNPGSPSGGSNGNNPDPNIPGQGNNGTAPQLVQALNDFLRSLLPSLNAVASTPTRQGVQNPTNPVNQPQPQPTPVQPRSPFSYVPPNQQPQAQPNPNGQNQQIPQSTWDRFTDELRRLAGYSQPLPTTDQTSGVQQNTQPTPSIPGTADSSAPINNAFLTPGSFPGSDQQGGQQGPRQNVALGGRGSPLGLTFAGCSGLSCIIEIDNSGMGGQAQPIDIQPAAPASQEQLPPGSQPSTQANGSLTGGPGSSVTPQGGRILRGIADAIFGGSAQANPGAARTAAGIRQAVADAVNQGRTALQYESRGDSLINYQNPPSWVPEDMRRFIQERYGRAVAFSPNSVEARASLIIADYAACQAVAGACGHIAEAQAPRAPNITSAHGEGYAADVRGFRNEAERTAYAASNLAAQQALGLQRPGMNVDSRVTDPRAGGGEVHIQTGGPAGAGAGLVYTNAAATGRQSNLDRIADPRLREIMRGVQQGRFITDALLAPGQAPPTTSNNSARQGGRPVIPGVPITYHGNIQLNNAPPQPRYLVIHESYGIGRPCLNRSGPCIPNPRAGLPSGGVNTALDQARRGLNSVGTAWWFMRGVHNGQTRMGLELTRPEVASTGHIGHNRPVGFRGGPLSDYMGIEVEGAPTVPLTAAERERFLASIRFLQERYNIPPENILFHGKDDGREGRALWQMVQDMNYRPGNGLPTTNIASGNPSQAPAASTETVPVVRRAFVDVFNVPQSNAATPPPTPAQNQAPIADDVRPSIMSRSLLLLPPTAFDVPQPITTVVETNPAGPPSPQQGTPDGDPNETREPRETPTPTAPKNVAQRLWDSVAALFTRTPTEGVPNGQGQGQASNTGGDGNGQGSQNGPGTGNGGTGNDSTQPNQQPAPITPPVPQLAVRPVATTDIPSEDRLTGIARTIARTFQGSMNTITDWTQAWYPAEQTPAPQGNTGESALAAADGRLDAILNDVTSAEAQRALQTMLTARALTDAAASIEGPLATAQANAEALASAERAYARAGMFTAVSAGQSYLSAAQQFSNSLDPIVDRIDDALDNPNLTPEARAQLTSMSDRLTTDIDRLNAAIEAQDSSRAGVIRSSLSRLSTEAGQFISRYIGGLNVEPSTVPVVAQNPEPMAPGISSVSPGIAAMLGNVDPIPDPRSGVVTSVPPQETTNPPQDRTNPVVDRSRPDQQYIPPRSTTDIVVSRFSNSGWFAYANPVSPIAQILQGLALLTGSRQMQATQNTQRPLVLTPYPYSPTQPTNPSTPSAQKPSVALVANPLAIKVGETTRLTWTSFRSTECEVKTPDGSSVTRGSSQGSVTTGALSTTTRFTLTCTGAGGSTSGSTTVYVGVPIPTSAYITMPEIVRTSSGTSGVTTGSPSQTTSNQQSYCDPGLPVDAFINCLNALPKSAFPI